MDRKTFLRTSLAGAAALVAAPGALVSCDSPEKKKASASTPLRLSFQEGVTPGETLAEKLDFMTSKYRPSAPASTVSSWLRTRR